LPLISSTIQTILSVQEFHLISLIKQVVESRGLLPPVGNCLF